MPSEECKNLDVQSFQTDRCRLSPSGIVVVDRRVSPNDSMTHHCATLDNGPLGRRAFHDGNCRRAPLDNDGRSIHRRGYDNARRNCIRGRGGFNNDGLS
jgi:hypothetical protein